MATPFDPTYKLTRKSRRAIAQPEYVKVIGFSMYGVISTRPYITFVVRKLSQSTGNPSKFHWHAIRRVLKYVKKNQNYGLYYSCFP